MRTTETHVRYLIENPKGRGVRVACTCSPGSPHGAEGYRSFEQAMETGRFEYYVPLWVNNPDVTRLCRNYAEKGTGIESLRRLIKL